MSIDRVDTEAQVPDLPTGSINLQPPPDQVEPQGAGNILANIIPMMGSMGVMAFMAVSAGDNPRMMLMGGAMVFAMLSMVAFNVYRQISQHVQKVNTTRREYLAYLTEMRDTVRTAARMQRHHGNWHLPDPRSLVLICEQGNRLWERKAGARDLLTVRLGSATQRLSMLLEEPELPPLANPDPVCHSAMGRFVITHSNVSDTPLGVSIDEFSHLEIVGNLESARAEARAMAAHLSTFVSPELFKIAVLCSDEMRPEWEWVKWLPHARSTEASDMLGAARMIASNYDELAALLGEEFTTRSAFAPRSETTPWPHLLLIVDDVKLPTNTRLGALEGTAGVTVITMQDSWGALVSRTTLRMVLRPDATPHGRGSMEAVWLDGEPIWAAPDAVSVAQAEAIARRMAPWVEQERPEAATPTGRSDPKRSADLMELLNLGDVRDFDPEQHWRRREGRDRLRVPLGVTPEGIPVVLDVKESAQSGMGPHGLLIGATGSGKSEVLRTLVLALALTHPPEQLNFVLVDFKGGATFAGMAELPHVSAMISNLESELSLVDRMQDALRGEMVRRQEILRKAGNYSNVTDYEADRVAGKHQYPPLPALLLILDEFSELLSAKPEFIDLFVAIGRLGRSMSIHLLLASQRLEEGRLRGLDSHLSYRIGLRTFSAQESRSVLGGPDAYKLPSIPGVGFLKAGTDDMTQFRASYVAAPPPPRKLESKAGKQAGAPTTAIEIVPFTSQQQVRRVTPAPPQPVVQPQPTTVPGDEQWAEKTQLDIAVARMSGHGTPAHQVWLPPLDVSETYDSLLSDLQIDLELGLISPALRERGRLRVPLGITDLPLEQRREVLELELTGAAGNVAVVGGPLSGKSTALRSIVLGLSLSHSPAEVQFYIMDFGGGTFATFEGAAHVAGVATRDRPDVVNRMVAEVENLVSDREKFFRANRIDSMGTYRQGRAQGKYDDGYGDVFLVVDGWSSVRSDFDDLEMRIQVLASRALTFGVHLVLSGGRWLDFRQQVRDLLGTKLELRLGDPTDSDISRKIAAQVPEGRPGRGLETGEHHILVALPRIDGDHDPETLSAGVSHALQQIQEAWGDRPAPKLRLLPERIALEELQKQAAEEDGLLLGLEESRLGPLCFYPDRESNLFLLGDTKSGKSTFLRSLAREVVRKATPKQAQFFLVDYRRSLLGELGEEYLAGYLTTREEAEQQLGELAAYLKTRLPGKDVTPDQLRNRSWWQGAEVWVLIDDYDLVVTSSGNPAAVLQSLLAQALDIGLHVVIARRSGGASRGMYEQLMQTMTDLGTTGILLSGDPEEGPLIGRNKLVRAIPGRAQVISRDAGRKIAQLADSAPKE